MTPSAPQPADSAPAGEDAATEPSAAGAPRKSRAWRWWLFGLVCAIGLGIFMWAVGGCWNVAAPQPDGPATAQMAVEGLVAAVDRHDVDRAKAECAPDLMPEVQAWIDETGYLRWTGVEVRAEEAPSADSSGRVIVRAKLGYVTRFLDDADPYGLNLALLVFPEPVEREFTVVRATGDEHWRVVDMGPIER